MGNTRWSSAQTRFLVAHLAAGDRSWEQLARHFRRSENAVRLKARRLGLRSPGSPGSVGVGVGVGGSMAAAPTYSREELADALGVTLYRIGVWRQRGWLAAEANSGRFRRAAVRAFLLAHWNEIDFGQVRPETFMEIVSSDGADGNEVG